MSDTEQKTKPATRRKLEKQRKKGIIAQSAELVGLCGLVAAVLVILGLFPYILERLFAAFDVVFQRIDDPFEQSARLVAGDLMILILLILVPVALVGAMVSVIAAMIYNKGIGFAMDPVTPKMNRVSPKTGFKRIYGRRGWTELGGTMLFLSLWILTIGTIGYIHLPQVIGIDLCGLDCADDVVLGFVIPAVSLALLLFLVRAGIDGLIQKSLFLHEQKMTESEFKREIKEQQGTPEIRRERRRLQMEAMEAAGKSGVDLANMLFYWEDRAIAVVYHPETEPIPRVTARTQTRAGVQKMREEIRNYGLPEEENAAIVAGTFSSQPGTYVNERVFQDLARAIERMFSVDD